MPWFADPERLTDGRWDDAPWEAPNASDCPSQVCTQLLGLQVNGWGPNLSTPISDDVPDDVSVCVLLSATGHANRKLAVCRCSSSRTQDYVTNLFADGRWFKTAQGWRKIVLVNTPLLAQLGLLGGGVEACVQLGKFDTPLHWCFGAAFWTDLDNTRIISVIRPPVAWVQATAQNDQNYGCARTCLHVALGGPAAAPTGCVATASCAPANATDPCWDRGAVLFGGACTCTTLPGTGKLRVEYRWAAGSDLDRCTALSFTPGGKTGFGCGSFHPYLTGSGDNTGTAPPEQFEFDEFDILQAQRDGAFRNDFALTCSAHFYQNTPGAATLRAFFVGAEAQTARQLTKPVAYRGGGSTCACDNPTATRWTVGVDDRGGIVIR